MTNQIDDGTMTRREIAGLLTSRCINCYSKLQGYNVRAPGWNWVTPNVGPFCDDCFKEIKDSKNKND